MAEIELHKLPIHEVVAGIAERLSVVDPGSIDALGLSIALLIASDEVKAAYNNAKANHSS